MDIRSSGVLNVSRWMVPVPASQSMVVKSKYLFGIRASGMIEIEEDEEEARRRGGEGTPPVYEKNSAMRGQ